MAGISGVDAIRAQSLAQGMIRTIRVGALAANEVRVYDENDSPLRETNTRYGYLNFISIQNLALTVNVEIGLDVGGGRILPVPGGAIIVEENAIFNSFTLTNLTGSVITAADAKLGKGITLMVGWQPPKAGVSISGLK